MSTTYTLSTYQITGGPVGGPATSGWQAHIANQNGMVVCTSALRATEQAALADLRTRAAVVGIEVV
ncbi:hypothetical protein [Streptomyces sp. NPDC001205]